MSLIDDRHHTSTEHVPEIAHTLWNADLVAEYVNEEPEEGQEYLERVKEGWRKHLGD